MTTDDPRCPRCGSKRRSDRLPAMAPRENPWLYGPGQTVPPCSHDWHEETR